MGPQHWHRDAAVAPQPRSPSLLVVRVGGSLTKKILTSLRRSLLRSTGCSAAYKSSSPNGFSGLSFVSGISAMMRTSPAIATPARNKKAEILPRSSAMYPATVVLNDAPVPTAAPQYGEVFFFSSAMSLAQFSYCLRSRRALARRTLRRSLRGGAAGASRGRRELFHQSPRAVLRVPARRGAGPRRSRAPSGRDRARAERLSRGDRRRSSGRRRLQRGRLSLDARAARLARVSARGDQIASGMAIPRPAIEAGEPSEKVKARQIEIEAVRTPLTRRASRRSSERTHRSSAPGICWRTPDWQYREDKVAWWNYFRLLDLSRRIMLDEPGAVSGLTFVERVRRHSYTSDRRPTAPSSIDIDIRLRKWICGAATN